MTASTSNRRRHISLGARLEAAERIRAGLAAPADVARELGVERPEVERWVASDERPVAIADVIASPEERRLARRAEALVALIALSDELIRRLNGRLAAECNKFGRFAQQAPAP